ncbi:serine/threonine-protein kinase [Crossiella equi]|uniref:non-specific serine/threonine protein kinase n=1 Tax=Crossiella equi TaxID=130796 RepID=A0ABS5A6I5_9PSEU|nr:protein kinase [Crossiella equi]MBP2471867.1 serine/threonine-protein kinase [Crossiella equi]
MLDLHHPARVFAEHLAERGLPLKRVLAFAGLSTITVVDTTARADVPAEEAVAKGLCGYYHVIEHAPPEQRPGVYGYYWYKRYGPAQHEAWRTAFHLEHQVLSALCGQPGIAEVWTAELAEGIPHFLMRHYARGSLAAHAGALGWQVDAELALTAAADIATGLEVLHGKGIVHRDLNAENVLRTDDGHFVLTDLGNARDVHAPPCGPSSRPDEFHWPPEYATGYDTADTRADLYSLGVLIHQLTTGRMPRHLGRSCQASAAGRFPPGLLAVADACLEPDPDNRPESAAEVLACLAPHR